MSGWEAAQWGALASWVTALASATACIAGFIGLSTWKRQDIWKADKDLARRILLALAHYQDAMQVALARQPAEDDPVWRKVATTRAELLALMQEARAVWQDDFPADLLTRLLTSERQALASTPAADGGRLGPAHQILQDIEALLRRKLGARR